MCIFNRYPSKNPKPFLTKPTAGQISKLPNNGLYVSKRTLNAANNKILKDESLDYLAKFSSSVTRGSLDQMWYKNYIKLLMSLDQEEIKNFKVKVMGNIVYVYLNTFDIDVRQNAHTILKCYGYNI